MNTNDLSLLLYCGIVLPNRILSILFEEYRRYIKNAAEFDTAARRTSFFADFYVTVITKQADEGDSEAVDYSYIVGTIITVFRIWEPLPALKLRERLLPSTENLHTARDRLALCRERLQRCLTLFGRHTPAEIKELIALIPEEPTLLLEGFGV